MNRFFRILLGVLLCGGAAYASGVEVHPSVLQESGNMNDKLQSLVTMDYGQSLVKHWIDSKIGVSKSGKKQNSKKPFQASSLWGVRPKTAPASEQSSGGNGVMDIYKKSMSPQALEKWKNESIAALNGPGRNPIVEAFKNSNSVNQKSAETAARIKELEQQG